MNIISYSFIRFLPYQETGEFVNVGVIAFSHTENTFDFKINMSQSNRVNGFFPEIDKRLFPSWVESKKEFLQNMKDANSVNSIETFKCLIQIEDNLCEYSCPIHSQTNKILSNEIEWLFKYYIKDES